MSENTVDRVLHRIKQVLPIESWLRFPMLIAVSGGPDSIALLRLLHRLKSEDSDDRASRSAAPMVVAHVNHGLRGRNSDADQAMVCELSESLGLKCFVTRLPIADRDSEELLRDSRYRFLISLAHEQGVRLVATGHQADDQVETILFRIFRGTGIGGLAGIPQISQLDETVSIVRPLLTVARAEIEQVLQELNQSFCTDESNLDSRYTRNFLRHYIIPQVISKFGSQFPNQLQRLALQANEVETYLNLQAGQFSNFILSRRDNEVIIDRRPFMNQPDIVTRQFFKLVWNEQGWPLQAMSFDKWQQLAETIALPEGNVAVFPGNVRCEVVGSNLVLSAKRKNFD